MPSSAISQGESAFHFQPPTRAVVISTHSVHQSAHGWGATASDYVSQIRIQTVPSAKKTASFNRCMGRNIRRRFPCSLTGRTVKVQERERNADWFSSLQPSRADAFCQDSELMKEAREHYFATHPWDWAHDNMADLSDVFRELAQGAGLLGKSIHEIQVSWSGPPHLRHANFVLRSLPKGLKFLRAVSTKESPKVMGLEGIHDPDAVWHFTRYTCCPWCGKDGQSEGTIMNYLRTIHYKLGLVCDQCYYCPTVTSEPSANTDATLAQIKALPPGGLFSLPSPESTQRSEGDVVFRPSSLGRLESLMKRALTITPPNQPSQITNTLHLSHDQNWTLLIATKAIFSWKSKQTLWLTFNYQRKNNTLNIK